ncbi:hypothetical protein QJS04_geneDACA013549 [Acorus gramineus]|uniref:DUF6857 domain-containing protein n=1 Tax=Acorus gramineus TaxID=55184 RepID=A0AAV9AJP4_ACOGR|nr:hypothetical protein QJS04_geneDACA013549 [Acorus gramineus]
MEPHEGEKLEWIRGSGEKEIQELNANLLKESQSWFLQFLDSSLSSGFQVSGTQEKKRKDGGLKKGSDSDIAITLSQLKQSNDWLNQLSGKLGSGNNDELEETINQLKQKIYTCLLNHVDSAALALENRSDHN